MHGVSYQTTWEKPPDYRAKRTPDKGKPHTAAPKEKSKGRGRGIMNFLTKIAKPKPDAESNVRAVKSANNETKDSKDLVEKEAVEANVESPKYSTLDTTQEAKLHTPIDVKSQSQVSSQAKELSTNEPGVKLAVETQAANEDFWLTLDDEVSASGGESDSESSEQSGGTATSMFSKRNIKTTVGKWAERITEKINSPANRPYETLEDGSEQTKAQNIPESLAIDRLENEPVTETSNGLSPRIKEESKPQAHSKVSNDEEGESSAMQPLKREDAPVETDEPITTEEKPNGYMPQDASVKGDAETIDRAILEQDDDAKASKEEPEDQLRTSDKTAKTNNLEVTVETTKKSPSKDVSRKTNWRSAIDAATGRTYYYVKGSMKVTWEKPTDL